jgi:hypothetical protein
MATSATNWRDAIQNYVGEDPGTRSWSNLRDKSYSRFFYPNLNTTGNYYGYQNLYSVFNRCLGLAEGYSPKPVGAVYLYIAKYFYYFISSFGVTYAGPSYGSSNLYKTHTANNSTVFQDSWTNFGGFFNYGYSFYGVSAVNLNSRSPSAFYQYYGSTNSNVAIGNNGGTPYQRINTYVGQC